VLLDKLSRAEGAGKNRNGGAAIEAAKTGVDGLFLVHLIATNAAAKTPDRGPHEFRGIAAKGWSTPLGAGLSRHLVLLAEHERTSLTRQRVKRLGIAISH